MADRVHRDIAELGAGFVEVIDHADRVFDQCGVVLHAVTAEDRQSRVVERCGEERTGLLGAVLLNRVLRIGADIKSFEPLNPKLETVRAVNRIVRLTVFVLAFVLKHQALDVFFSLLGRSQRDSRCRRGSCTFAAELEGEELLRGIIDGIRIFVAAGVFRSRGIEIDVKSRVGLRFAGRNRFFGDVVVAGDLVNGKGLFGQRVAAYAGDFEHDLRRVEDRHVSEITRIDLIVINHLREEPCLALAERVVDAGSEIAVGDVRADQRVALKQPRLDVFPGVHLLAEEFDVSGLHLLIVRNEVSAQRIVYLGAAREHRSDHGGQCCDREQLAAEIIELLHRIGCNYRKSPPPRVTGIRAWAFRLRGPYRAPWGRHPEKPPPHRRHIP